MLRYKIYKLTSIRDFYEFYKLLIFIMRIQPHGLRLTITTNWKQRSNFFYSPKYYSFYYWQLFYLLEIFNFYKVQLFSNRSNYFVFLPYTFLKLAGSNLVKSFFLNYTLKYFLKHKQILIKTQAPDRTLQALFTRSLSDLGSFQKLLLKFNYAKFTISEFFASIIFFKKYFKYFTFLQFQKFRLFIPSNISLVINFIRAYFFLRYRKTITHRLRVNKRNFVSNYLVTTPTILKKKFCLFFLHFCFKKSLKYNHKNRFIFFFLAQSGLILPFFFVRNFFLNSSSLINLEFSKRSRFFFSKNKSKSKSKLKHPTKGMFNKKAYFQQKREFYARLRRLKKFTPGYYNFLTFLTRRSKPFLCQLFFKYPGMIFFKNFFKNSFSFFFRKYFFKHYYAFSSYLYFVKYKQQKLGFFSRRSLQLGFLGGDFFSTKLFRRKRSKKQLGGYQKRHFRQILSKKIIYRYTRLFKKQTKNFFFPFFRVWFFSKKYRFLIKKKIRDNVIRSRKRFLVKQSNQLFAFFSRRLLKKKLFIFSHNYISLYFNYFFLVFLKKYSFMNLRFFDRFFLKNSFFKVYTNFFYFNSFNVLSLKYPFFSLAYFKSIQHYKPQYVYKIKPLFEDGKDRRLGLEDIYNFPGPYFRLPPIWRFDFFSKLVFALSLQQSEYILNIIVFYFEKTKNHTAFWSLLNFILTHYSLVIPGLMLTISGKFRPRYGGKKIKKKTRTYKYGLPISLQSLNTFICYSEQSGNSYLGAFGFKLVLLKQYGSKV